MKRPLILLVALLLDGGLVAPFPNAATVGRAWAEEADGFVSLFNGRDLSGWVNVNCAPETWSVRDGMIHCTGLPTGALRTARQYENFILELEWCHLSSGGNSGVFIWSSPVAAPGVPFLRAIEVQVLDHGFNIPGKNEWYTTHGDVFPIHGSTMEPFGRHNGMRSFPSEERSKGSPEWNHYRIVCTNGVLRLHVNGKEVSGGQQCSYRKGYLGLESEGAPIDFRNLRIKELASPGATAEQSAPLDQGWRSLFTGLDLRGWQTNSATSSRWSVEGEHIVLRAGSGSPECVLWTAAEFGDAEFIVDCRVTKPGAGQDGGGCAVYLGGDKDSTALRLPADKPEAYHRFAISVKGREVSVKADGKTIQEVTLDGNDPTRRRLGLSGAEGGAEFMNVYVRELTGKGGN
jgi:hypothetical protein